MPFATPRQRAAQTNMRNIVIIHAGAIGDLVLALPALGAVRAAWPGARVTLLARPERAALARLAGLVDAVADLETSGLWRLMGERSAPGPLPAPLEGADLVVDFLSQGALASHLAGRRVATVHPMPPEGWTESAAAWYLRQVCGALALPQAPTEPEVAIRREALDLARRDLAARGLAGRFAAIHPGSGSPRKNWPLERFAEVAGRLRAGPPHPTLSHKGRGEKRLPLAVLWIAGPAERERGRPPPAATGDAVLAEPPLETLAAVLAAADVYIGNDSGITHLAAAVRGPGGRRTPTVAIFGPTDPRVWAPRGPHVRVVGSAGGEIDGVSAARVWHAVRQAVTAA